MVNVKLFKADGGKVRGLTQVGEGKFGAAPKEGDYINMDAAADAPAYKIDAVVFLLNEDAVRLIVSPIGV